MSTTLAFDIIARDRASDNFDRVGNSATRSAAKLKKFAAIGAAAVAAGAVVAGRALAGMAQAAADDDKAQQVLAMSMRNAAGASDKQVAATERWIAAQGKAKGIADDELRPAMARLVQATGNVGKAQRLAGLAMDISAGTGRSLKSVTDALAKAQTGSLAGLSKMGVVVKGTEGNQRSLFAITKDLADLHGGQAAAAAGTSAGKMQRLSVVYDEIKETIGAKLIPVMGDAATASLKFINQFQKGEGTGGRVRDVLEQVGSALGKVKNNFGTIAPIIGVVTAGMVAYSAATKVAAVVTAIQTAGTTAATGATWSLNAALRANPIGVVITLLTAMGVGLVLLYKKSDTFRTIVNKAWASVKDGASAMWGGIKVTFAAMKAGFEALGRAGTWLWNNALQPAFKFIVSGVASILDLWSTMLANLAKVPGFGWAKQAADAMANAATKARAMADGIKKIPNKTVTVTVQYKYTGLRGPGGSGSTRSGDPSDDYLGRQALGPMSPAAAASKAMDMLADAYRSGGKKVQKVLGDNVQRMRSALQQIRDDMRSMSSSIAQALTPDAFGFSDIPAEYDAVTGAVVTAGQSALSQMMASLTSTNTGLSGLTGLFSKLQGSVSKGFLSSIMQSGNTTLMTQLANDPTAAAEASRLFDANASMAEGLGDKTAQAVLGDRFEKVTKDELKRVRDDLEKLPEKFAKHLQRELKDMRIEMTGRDAGGRAYLRIGR